MKPFYIITACLCLYAFSAYPQTDTDGNYMFSKAVATAYNYNTQAEVFTHVFNDTVALKDLNELPFPIQPVFLSAYIQGGVLTACTLWNNSKDYSVQEEGHLLVPLKNPDNALILSALSSGSNPAEVDIFSQPFYLSPLYTLDINGNTATFTFTDAYGNGAYGFPLKGIFVMTLVKDENFK